VLIFSRFSETLDAPEQHAFPYFEREGLTEISFDKNLLWNLFG
jgi:hypothetical protein